MMTMIENGVIASEKTNTKMNSFTEFNSNSNINSSNIMMPQHHLNQNTLFSAFDSEMNANNTSKIVTLKDHNNNNNNNSHNYFQFEHQQHHNHAENGRNGDSDLLDYNYFTRFTSLIEMNSQNNDDSPSSYDNHNQTNNNNDSIETTSKGINDFQNGHSTYDLQLNHGNNICAYCVITTDIHMTTLECNVHRVCRKCFKTTVFAHKAANGSPISMSSSRKNSESKYDMKLMNSTGLANESNAKINERIIQVRNKHSNYL